jgi:hypothetical protein
MRRRRRQVEIRGFEEEIEKEEVEAEGSRSGDIR